MVPPQLLGNKKMTIQLLRWEITRPFYYKHSHPFGQRNTSCIPIVTKTWLSQLSEMADFGLHGIIDISDCIYASRVLPVDTHTARIATKRLRNLSECSAVRSFTRLPACWARGSAMHKSVKSHVQNKMLKAMATQQQATHGLLRSPMRAHFQKRPSSPSLFLSRRLG